jgi:hypothetical protein
MWRAVYCNSVIRLYEFFLNGQHYRLHTLHNKEAVRKLGTSRWAAYPREARVEFRFFTRIDTHPIADQKHGPSA